MPGVRRLLKTLRELGFPAADARSGALGGSANGLLDIDGHAGVLSTAGADTQVLEIPEPREGSPLPFAAAALLREYEAWLGDWDDACARAALGGTQALDTIYAFARLRTTFPFAPDVLDDATLEALCARPWDAHHRALLGFDPDLSPARIRDDAERRIGQACAILGDAALAVPTEGDYRNKLHWLRRIATAHGKVATEALLAALLAPPGEPLLSVATTQNRHGAAAVLGRLCERARLTITGPVGGALAALDARYQHVLETRPVLVHRHAGEQPQVDWLLPLALEVGDASDEDEPIGAPYGRRLRALVETARTLEDWYMSAAAALRAVAAERSTHASPPRPAALEALAGRRVGEVVGETGRRDADVLGHSAARRTREETSPQRAALTMERARARAQLTREQLREAAALIERAGAPEWVQVVATARQLERWLTPVARGWVETDPSVTPLIREVRELVAHLAALTAPPVKHVEAPATPYEVEPPVEVEQTPEQAVVEPVVPDAVASVALDSTDAPEWSAAQTEAYELPEIPLEAEPVVEPVQEASPAKPKRRRTRKKITPPVDMAAEAKVEIPPVPKRRPRKRKADAPVEPADAPVEPVEAAAPEPTPTAELTPDPEPVAEIALELEAELALGPEPEVALGPEPKPEPEPETEPEPKPEPPRPPIDWTPQLKTIETLGTQWAQRSHKRHRPGGNGAPGDPERERLIAQLNQLVWPIVSDGIDPSSGAAATIRRTLEPIVNEANRFADRQHGRAMFAFRHGATQANSFGARKAMREALQEVEAGLEYPVPECPGPFQDVREDYDATRNRLLLLRNYIAVKL